MAANTGLMAKEMQLIHMTVQLPGGRVTTNNFHPLTYSGAMAVLVTALATNYVYAFLKIRTINGTIYHAIMAIITFVSSNKLYCYICYPYMIYIILFLSNE